MRAVAIESFGGPERLSLTDLPRPKAGRGEVLVRAVAAGVNPVDWKIREGLLESRLPHAFPLVPGWDVAGVVEEIGEGTSRFRKGDKVWAYARKPVVQWGTYAEFVAVSEEHAALMPSAYLFEEAAAVPLAALTAYQALFSVARLEKGVTVLVHAAAGGVGHFAVQLAARAGARVLGTAGSDHHSFVLELGADRAIDYHEEDFRDAVRRLCPEGVDIVLDAVGGDTQTRSLEILKERGILVSIVGEPDAGEAAERGVRARWILVEPDGEQLTILAREVDRGRLRAHVSRMLPLSEAARAHEESRAGHVRGKLVLTL
jgi:NADPH2:quinone reductase